MAEESSLLLSLPDDCLGRVVYFADLRSRLRLSAVCKSIRRAVYSVAPIVQTLSIKYTDMHGGGGRRFMVNNELRCDTNRVQKALNFWTTQRTRGRTFELVLNDWPRISFWEALFGRLSGLKHLRLQDQTRSFLDGMLILFSAYNRLIGQSAATLETLSIGRYSIPESTLSAIATCQNLRSVAFDMPPLKIGSKPALFGIDSPSIQRVRIDSQIETIRSHPFSDYEEGFSKLRPLITEMTHVVAPNPAKDHPQFDGYDAYPQLQLVMWMENHPSSLSAEHVMPVARPDAEAALIRLFRNRRCKPRRWLTVVMATHLCHDAPHELYTLRATRLRPKRLPTVEGDAKCMAMLRGRAMVEGLHDLLIERVEGGEVGPPMHQLPASMSSRRQFKLSTAALTVKLVLLPDY